MKNIEILTNISNAKMIIEDYTLAGILDKTDSKHILCKKIANTARALYVNAYRITMEKQPLLSIKHKTLSLENIKALMGEICNVLARPLFAEEIEAYIIQLLRKYSLNPEELFVENIPLNDKIAELQNTFNDN